MDGGLRGMAGAWSRAKRDEEAMARERAALQLAAGVDLDAALATKGEARERLLLRLGRMLERERLRASRPAAPYDLDRHIALKKMLDRLAGRPARPLDATPRRGRPAAS